MVYYPTDSAGRDELAESLVISGMRPTQVQRHWDRDKINWLADRLAIGLFDWVATKRSPVFLGPDDEILDGHHRVVAIWLSGIDWPRFCLVPGQVIRLPVCHRLTYDWHDVLPDVL